MKNLTLIESQHFSLTKGGALISMGGGGGVYMDSVLGEFVHL